MKNVKKLIGILLVIAMIAGVMSTTAFAAVPDGKVIRYVVTPDKASYAAGDVATFTVAAETLAAAAPIDGTIQLDLAYNSAKYAPLTTLSLTPLADAGVDYSGTVLDGKVSDSDSSCETGTVVGTAFLEEDVAAYGWDESANVIIIPSGIDTYDFSSGLTTLFTIKMNVLADVDATGADAVKINLGACEMGVNFLSLMGEGYEEAPYDPSFCVSEIGEVAVANPIVWKQNQVRPAESGLANAIDIGVKAEFSAEDIAIDFDQKGTSTNYKTVGAELQVNGAPAGTGESAFVYEVEGNYQYRVIIKDVAKDSTDVYTLKFFAKDMNDNITYGETVEVSVADCDLTKLPA